MPALDVSIVAAPLPGLSPPAGTGPVQDFGGCRVAVWGHGDPDEGLTVNVFQVLTGPRTVAVATWCRGDWGVPTEYTAAAPPPGTSPGMWVSPVLTSRRRRRDAAIRGA